MAIHTVIQIVAYIIIVPYVQVSKAADSLSLSQSITDGNTLVSQGGIFELGFFSPGKKSHSKKKRKHRKEEERIERKAKKLDNDSAQKNSILMIEIESPKGCILRFGLESNNMGRSINNVSSNKVVLDLEKKPIILSSLLINVYAIVVPCVNVAKAFCHAQSIIDAGGYMAPEYAVDGYFSVKSDVFSFGILMLEVICGKRNKAYYYTDTTLNLVGQAWTLWKEDKALELIDSNLRDSYVLSEVLRCMHVSLLCVQQHPDDRPTMESVILMLGSEMQLVEPKEPGFISKNVSSELGLHTNLTDRSLSKEMTISLLDPR
ncbi:hypothetical protein VNO78_06312 [Psophocarpus tetragonolobus]|uniref:Serine-threonine/tyrosine-protein kinase catalytic domain-containing protein n=1 Tax=Psophocarpus tetragonolobus TaxID=3891 RepID=A0AAN9SS94_PSOTE